MPTYIRGSADGNGYYSGLAIADETTLLTQIRDGLVTAGWTIIADTISSNKKVKLSGLSNGHLCRVEFSTSNVTLNEKKLSLIGDKTGANTVLSPAIDLPFIADGQSKLFLTADAAGGCLMVFNPAGVTKSAHFGFLERTVPTNQFAWMIGFLDCALTKAYVAESTIGGTTWKENHTFYYSSTESQTSPNAAYQYIWDGLTTGLGGTAFTTSSNTSFAYKPWLGAIDPVTGKPLLGSYGYLEGYTTNSSYPVDANKATALHFPGFVRYARTGLASLAPAIQVKEGTKTFISGGASADFLQGFQGFQIAD